MSQGVLRARKSMRSLVFSSSILVLLLSCLTDATFLPLLAALAKRARNTDSAFQGVRGSDTGDNVPLRWQPSISYESVQDIRDHNNFAVQIVREEAPLIRQVEIQINEGLEAEKNLTAVREAIVRELDEAKKTGRVGLSSRRFRMERQLQQLDDRLIELHAKNQEAAKRFRNFVGGIDSGRIRSRRQARAELGGISNFCTHVVMHYVNASVSLVASIINFSKNIVAGIAKIFRGILGLKLRSVQAGVNLVAGI